MAEEKRGRRAKNVNASRHRTGSFRAAVKPSEQAKKMSVLSIIESFFVQVSNVELKQSAWGDALTKAAFQLQANFALKPDDIPFFVLDLSGTGTCSSGLLLSSTGVHLADGKGATADISYSELTSLTTGLNAQGQLVIGSYLINSPDNEVIAALLRYIQQSLATH